MHGWTRGLARDALRAHCKRPELAREALRAQLGLPDGTGGTPCVLSGIHGTAAVPCGASRWHGRRSVRGWACRMARDALRAHFSEYTEPLPCHAG